MRRGIIFLFSMAVLLVLVVVSCASSGAAAKRNVIKSIQPSLKTPYKRGDKVTFSFNTSVKFDSAFLNIAGKAPVKSLKETVFVCQLGENDKIGENSYKITLYHKGDSYEKSGKFMILPKEPVRKTIDVKHTLNHSRDAYTQGLEFYNGNLYESSGEYGKSYLQILEFPSMKSLKRIDLDDKYFAEGLTILNDKLYLLTWKEKKAFVYDAKTLEKIDEFGYDTEGWGLTNDGEKLYLSDGSSAIYKINPKDFTVESKINVLTDKGEVMNVNELEWIDGKIYANVYGYDSILIIDPVSGEVETVAFGSNLLSPSDKNSTTDVMNGIALNKITGKIYITGKNWPKLFEIEIR